MAEHWWRAYDSSIDHPKLLRLSDAMHRAWFTLQCVASSNGGVLPPAGDIALRLRMKPSKVAEWITHLVAGGLIDRDGDSFRPHNWDQRQYKTDLADPTAASRAKRYRDRKRDDRDATVTDKRPEQSSTDTEQSRADARAVVSGSEKALRSDLMELFGSSKCPDLSRAGVWLSKGYSPSMVVEVVRELVARKPDVASLAYFDAALAERHAKRGMTPSEIAAVPIDYDKIVSLYARTRVWSKYAGPEPGQIGCRAPPEMLERHGLAPDGQKIRNSAMA